MLVVIVSFKDDVCESWYVIVHDIIVLRIVTYCQEDHRGACLKKLLLPFKLLAIEQISQKDHTGVCLKELSLTFKLLLIKQITGEMY